MLEPIFYDRYSGLRIPTELCIMDSVSKQFACFSCESAFSTFSNLKRHVLKFHPSEVNQLESSKRRLNDDFLCDICAKKFMYESTLKFHKRNHEQEKPPPKQITNPNQKCPLCDFTDDKTSVIRHFTNVHDITIVKETISFDTTEQFEIWKNDFEQDSKSRFVKEYSRSTAKYKNITFICHRSGKFISESKGFRRLKSQGSNKIGALCPANIKLQINKGNETCIAFVITTHVGHTCDIERLSLTPSERKQLANQIESNIPFGDILDQVRDSLTDGKLQRINLLTKKDLYNIRHGFNLHSTCIQHANDAVSVESWANEMEAKSDAILLHKMKDSLVEEWPELKSEDYLLAIMTDAQCEMLKLYGSDVVCIDSAHGCNKYYDYDLITLMVVDDMRQGFPCAFLITNRSDTIALKIFFNCIKLRVGTISADLFMSDMAEQFANAWCQVMNYPTLRLYCTWYVDQAWRKNLHKIKAKEKQVIVYKQLRTALQETDVIAFDKMLEALYISLYEDEDTNDFAEYFKIFLINPEPWAYCYRIDAGINTNVYLETMHQTLKQIYSKGKKTKRLDKAIQKLMQLVRDKWFDRLLVLNKGKITHKLKLIRDRHKHSIALNANIEVACDNGWNISSSTKSEIYSVQKLTDNSCDCQLICSDCETCIHKFCCSCIDSAIKYNMCKHIHLLCGFLKATNTLMLEVESEVKYEIHQDIICEGSNNVEIECDNREAESQVICELTSKPPASKLNSLLTKKELVSKRLLGIIASLQTDEELEVFERLLNPVEPTLAAMRKSRHTHK